MWSKHLSAFRHTYHKQQYSIGFKCIWYSIDTVKNKMPIKAALIDLSGTLHVEDQPTPDAVSALKRLVDLIEYISKFLTKKCNFSGIDYVNLEYILDLLQTQQKNPDKRY